MKHLNNWSILISVEENYDEFVEQVARLAKSYAPTHLNFVLVDRKEELPKEFLNEVADIIQMESAERLQRFKDKVGSRLQSDHKTSYTQLNNAKIGQVLRSISDHKTDLLIVSKSVENGLTGFQYKVVRKTGANVLLASSSDDFEWENIVLPIDFSSYSDLAIEYAKAIELNKNMEPELRFIHAYQDASKYLDQVFETADEVQVALKRSAMLNPKLTKYTKHRMTKFLDQHFSFGVRAEVYEYGREENAAEVLINKLQELAPGLVIVGSKGTGKTRASLMGNTCDDLIRHQGESSLLVVKQKNENIKFLRNFLQ